MCTSWRGMQQGSSHLPFPAHNAAVTRACLSGAAWPMVLPGQCMTNARWASWILCKVCGCSDHWASQVRCCIGGLQCKHTADGRPYAGAQLPRCRQLYLGCCELSWLGCCMWRQAGPLRLQGSGCVLRGLARAGLCSPEQRARAGKAARAAGPGQGLSLRQLALGQPLGARHVDLGCGASVWDRCGLQEGGAQRWLCGRVGRHGAAHGGCDGHLGRMQLRVEPVAAEAGARGAAGSCLGAEAASRPGCTDQGRRPEGAHQSRCGLGEQQGGMPSTLTPTCESAVVRGQQQGDSHAHLGQSVWVAMHMLQHFQCTLTFACRGPHPGSCTAVTAIRMLAGGPPVVGRL